MAQAAKSQEPSMEEILASIRRIIAEDDSDKASPPPTTEAAPVELSPDTAASPLGAGRAIAESSSQPPETPVSNLGALSASNKAARSAPVPDLAEPVASSVSRTAAPAVDSTPAPVPPTPADDAANETVSRSQSSSADERGGLMSTAPTASSAPRSAAPAVDSTPAPVPPTPADHAANETISSSQSSSADEEERGGLVSTATSAAVDSAFNALAQTVLVHNAHTLEDLVREMLRPMLKVWLNDNLPGIVERSVRAEIERVSRGRRA
jgi:cell pole-organizing protein PopZ